MNSDNELLKGFINSDENYRPVTMWWWNDELCEEEITEQLEGFKSKGVNEFFVNHVWGAKDEYLGERFFEVVKHTVKEAKRLGMKYWIYDEFNWPSGSCKGRVPRENPEWAYSEYEVERLEDGSFAWRIERDLAFGANNYSLEAMDRFRELTHEKYEARLKRHFGKTVRGIMTDEPAHYSLSRRREVAARCRATGHMVDHFRWWRECEADYSEATGGRDFRKDAEAWYAGGTNDSVWRIYTENLSRRFRQVSLRLWMRRRH